MEDLAAPAYVIDRDGRFSWVNRAHVDLFGDLRGHPFVDYVAPEHRQLARANFARKVVGNTTRIFDLRVIDRRGEKVTLRITSAPLRRGRQVVGVFGIGVPLQEPAAQAPALTPDLTPREQEVLRLLAEGLETPEIAQRLGVAEETARNHIRALLRATGAHSRLEVVVTALRLGILGPEMTHTGQQESEPSPDE